jgi:hypothetical protein
LKGRPNEGLFFQRLNVKRFHNLIRRDFNPNQTQVPCRYLIGVSSVVSYATPMGADNQVKSTAVPGDLSANNSFDEHAPPDVTLQLS